MLLFILLSATSVCSMAQEPAKPILDLPVNIVEGKTFPNIQFFGGDIEESAMKYSISNNLKPLPLAVNIIGKLLRDNLGDDVVDKYGAAKEFLFFVSAVLATEDKDDKRQSPIWSNSSPNMFSEKFCRDLDVATNECFERVLSHVNAALPKENDTPAPVYSAQLTINGQPAIFPFFQGDTSISVVNTWFQANKMPLEPADVDNILNAVRATMIKDQFFTAKLVAEITLNLSGRSHTIRMFQGETIEKVAASFCDYHSLDAATAAKQVEQFLTNGMTEGVVVPVDFILTLNINQKLVEVMSYAGDTVQNIARRLISQYPLGRGVTETVTTAIMTEIERVKGKIKAPAAPAAPAAPETTEKQPMAPAKESVPSQLGNGVYNVMVCQIPIQIDGSTVVLKAYEGEEVQALVESFIVTKNGQFANQKQQVVDAVLGAARDQQPTPTVVQTTIPNVQIQAAVNGDVVIYENDSFNNVVRRYTYAFGLSYEEGVALEMFVKEHFAKSQQAANTAETAETEETAETAETVAEESNALETFWNVWIPENWAALVLSMSLTEQVSTKASTGQSVFVATVIVAVLVIARMLHNPAASEAAPAETTKDVPLVATKTTEETSDKKVSTKKKSKKRAKSVGKKK